MILDHERFKSFEFDGDVGVRDQRFHELKLVAKTAVDGWELVADHKEFALNRAIEARSQQGKPWCCGAHGGTNHVHHKPVRDDPLTAPGWAVEHKACARLLPGGCANSGKPTQEV